MNQNITKENQLQSTNDAYISLFTYKFKSILKYNILGIDKDVIIEKPSAIYQEMPLTQARKNLFY